MGRPLRKLMEKSSYLIKVPPLMAVYDVPGVAAVNSHLPGSYCSLGLDKRPIPLTHKLLDCPFNILQYIRVFDNIASRYKESFFHFSFLFKFSDILGIIFIFIFFYFSRNGKRCNFVYIIENISDFINFKHCKC
jgi:hypothetical protein